MTAAIVAPAYVPLPAEGRYRRVLAALRAAARRGLRFRLRCLIMGHEDAFARQPHRLMLRCAACGRETVGWAIGPGAPTAAVATRHATPFSRLAAVAPGPRVRPWGLGPWRARADARDRQRLRMVRAARAAERRSDDAGPTAGRPAEGVTRLHGAIPNPTAGWRRRGAGAPVSAITPGRPTVPRRRRP